MGKFDVCEQFGSKMANQVKQAWNFSGMGRQRWRLCARTLLYFISLSLLTNYFSLLTSCQDTSQGTHRALQSVREEGKLMAPNTNYTDLINHTENSQTHSPHKHTVLTNTQATLLKSIINHTNTETSQTHSPHY